MNRENSVPSSLVDKMGKEILWLFHFGAHARVTRQKGDERCVCVCVIVWLCVSMYQRIKCECVSVYTNEFNVCVCMYVCVYVCVCV